MSAKVYVLTRGEYSDYGIEGVFSTKELAEKYARRIEKLQGAPHKETDVEEWDLDPVDLAPIMHPYRAWLGKGGRTSVQYGAGDGSKVSVSRDGTVFVPRILARSKQHAARVASEKRAEFLTQIGFDPEY